MIRRTEKVPPKEKRVRVGLALAALATIGVALAGIFATTIRDASERDAFTDVRFHISCSARSEALFKRATVLLHSLRFVEAEEVYTGLAADEPDCAMAYWGIAMSRLKRPAASGPALADARVARTALRRAATAATATSRERDYLAAIDLLFRDQDPPAWRDRASAYAQAMGQIAERYPADREATIFYALALNMAAQLGDETFRLRTKAAELLLVALSEQPHHPGLSHYLVYCLNLPAGETPDLSKVRGIQTTSRAQTVFAAAALVGVVAFFAAMLPIWSGLRMPRHEDRKLRSAGEV